MKVLATVLTILSTVGLAQVSAQTIADYVAGEDDFSTLFAALQASGLAETLAGEGPFTVFAPTNEAFDVLKSYSPGTLEAMLNGESPEVLEDILLYHVASGVITSDDIANGLTSVESLQGENITLSASTDSMPAMVDGYSTIITTGVPLDNGIIHVISTALLPKAVEVMPSIIIAANSSRPDFSVLLGLLESAQLGGNLNAPGPFTVFAPIDDAFAAISDLEELTSDPQTIFAILINHAVAGKYTSDMLTDGQVLTTIGQQQLFVSIVGDTVMINNATVVQADIIGSNGVIHAIDSVIIPDDSAFDTNYTISNSPSGAPGLDDEPRFEGDGDSAAGIVSPNTVLATIFASITMFYSMLV